MALRIYENSTDSVPISSSDTFSNAWTESIDGRTGGSIEKKLYVKNDETVYDYSDIQVYAIQTSGSFDLLAGTKGFSVKFSEGATRPSLEQWNTIQVDNTIDLADITDVSTALPFWIRIQVPSNVPVQQVRGIKIAVYATESL